MRVFRLAPGAALVAVGIAAAGRIPGGNALPLFSRSFGVACNQCHSTLPRLSPAGIAFAQLGYREAGPGAALPAHARELPISVVGDAGVAVSRPGTNPPSSRRPLASESLRGEVLQLQSSGAVAGRISYHVGVGIEQHPADHDGDNGFVQWDDVMRDGALNVRAGRFDAELPMISEQRRTTLTDYLSPVAFDARGLELNGSRARWTYAVGVARSARRMPEAASLEAIANPLEDRYLRVSRGIGRHLLAAQMLFDRQGSNLPTHAWLQHLRGQLAATLGPPRFTVIPAYVFDRFDDRPIAGMHERHQYYMLETLALLDPEGRWAVTGRYEHDYRTRNRYDPEQHRQLAAVDLAYQVIANGKIAIEWANTDDRLLRRHHDELDTFVQASW